MATPGKNTRKTGDLGEQIAEIYLKNKGFSIITRNYLKLWGEIDIIAEQGGLVHFVEVKAVSYETKTALEYAVTHETWRPEEHVHARKIHQISKAIDSWIREVEYEGDWQIDVIAVRMVPTEKIARVRFIDNVVLG